VSLTIHSASLKDVRVITSRAYEDDRGLFKEVFRADFLAAAEIDINFVQDNVSRSRRGVLRGLHMVAGMAKLVQVISGSTYHVIADMRRESPTYLQWESFDLSGDVHTQLFVPAGFVNGFYVVSDQAYVHYKQNVYYTPANEQVVRWNDPVLGVKWPTDSPILSDKDRAAPDYHPA